MYLEFINFRGILQLTKYMRGSLTFQESLLSVLYSMWQLCFINKINYNNNCTFNIDCSKFEDVYEGLKYFKLLIKISPAENDGIYL